MRRGQDGPALGPERSQQVHDAPGPLRIHVGGRLVEQQQGRGEDQRAGDGPSLAFPSGQALHARPSQCSEAEAVEEGIGPALVVGAGPAERHERQQHVLSERHAPDQRRLLEHQAHRLTAQPGPVVVPQARDLPSAEP